MKPAIFIGSSVEGLNVARAIQAELDHDANVTIWNQGIFGLSNTTIDDLLDVLSKADFGVFIFSPDDLVQIRDEQFLSVRDNVVFELGLFIGGLGKKRSFFILPEDNKGFRLPTDLIGVTPATYNAQREDNNLQAALAPASHKIRTAITKLGVLKRILPISASIANQPDDSFYHFRVQRLIVGPTEKNQPEFVFNTDKDYLVSVAEKLSNNLPVHVGGVTLEGIDINYRAASLIVLRSETKLDTGVLKNESDTKIKDQYWHDLRYTDGVKDITAQLDIADGTR
jgi:hypothetical protein